MTGRANHRKKNGAKSLSQSARLRSEQVFGLAVTALGRSKKVATEGWPLLFLGEKTPGVQQE